MTNKTFPERGAVVGYAYKNIDRETRNKVIKNVVGEAMNISKVSRVVVIGVDVERNDYPYSVATYCLSEDDDLSE